MPDMFPLFALLLHQNMTSSSHTTSSTDESQLFSPPPEHDDCRMLDETDSDKDLVITSLTESLQIHKEILERLHHDKEAFIAKTNEERLEEREETERLVQEAMERYRRLETAYTTVVQELEAKKAEYNRMESKFYAHVKR